MALDPFKLGLIANFAVEAQELCSNITRAILELERASADAPMLAKTYDQLARGLHTVKGSSATLGLADVSELAHRMEDLVIKKRDTKKPLPSDAVDALLRSVDVLIAQVKAVAAGQSTKANFSDTLSTLDKAIRGESIEPAKPAQQKAAAPAEKGAQQPAKDQPAQAIPDPAVAPARMDAAVTLEDAGSWRVATKDVIALMREVERLREVRLRLEERRRQMETVLSHMAKLSIFSETAEVRGMVMAVTRALGSDGEESADIVDSLEQGLKAICTLPVRTVLDPLNRAVRDLCRQSGKEAKLEVVGAEVSLDRRVLESLKAPLVHLVRNSVDHGIESPEERERRGKHREGALVVRVEQQGNVLFLEVSDDGNGLDTDRIRSEALKRGVITTEQAQTMHTQQINEIIFQSGFSTRTEVTETSGRGYGLDVVRNQLMALQGHIEVQSVTGQGSRFILTLPAELGSSPVLVVRCGEHQLGLPLLAVEHIRATRQKEIRASSSKTQLEYREQLLPVQDLGAVVGLRQPISPSEGQPLMVLHSQGKRLAVSVDAIIGDWDLVIRPLPVEVREVPAYQGSATMTGGELMLVLRPDWLVDQEKQTEAPRQAGRRALVVDDSLTARALHRTMLEAGGFIVHTTSSGRQALDQLRSATYDIVVCDIGMDDMDGMALTSAIRARPETKSLPVILVSAHDSETDRQRGTAAGADGFLSKKDCEAGRLLSEVSAVIARRKGIS